MSGLPDGQRETAWQIVREHHITDNDPIVALLALIRLHDSAFVVALDSHAAQFSHEIAELKKDLAQTREAPRLVAKSVEALHVQTAGIEKSAKELSDISVRVVVLFAVCGMVIGGILSVAAGKFLNLL